MTEVIVKGKVRYVDGVGDYHNEELPKLNIDLLNECVGWAMFRSAMPGEPLWFQNSWHTYVEEWNEPECQVQEQGYCGTSFCLFGYAVHVSGGSKSVGELVTKGIMTEEQIRDHFGCSVKTLMGSADAWFHEMTDPAMIGHDGNLVAPEARDWDSLGWGVAGQAVLGLTEAEANALSDGDNTLDDVIEYATDIALSRGLVLTPK